MAELATFLRRIAEVPLIYGQSDCFLTAADWVREVEGFDPAAAWRGRCCDRAGALALLKQAGGVVAMAQAGMNRPRISNPKAGDVGVVVTQGSNGPVEVAAICTGARWAAKTERGLWIGRAEPLAAWRVG